MALLAGFVVCIGFAVAQYPGGTWCDKSSTGFHPVMNYLCDLLHDRGLNGAENPGARLARGGMLCLALALVPFWLGVARLGAQSPRLARVAGALGLLSAVGTLFVSLNPSDRFLALHQLAVLSTTGAAIGAASAGCLGLLAARHIRLAALGFSPLGLGALDGALYLHQVLNPARCAVVLPLLQKFAALTVFAWMLSVAFVLFSGASTTGSRAP